LETTHLAGRRLGLTELIDSKHIGPRLCATLHEKAIGNGISGKFLREGLRGKSFQLIGFCDGKAGALDGDPLVAAELVE
jgi:hypothetical protein